jgi:hypothetical protein
MKIFSAKIMSMGLMRGGRLRLRKTAAAASAANIAHL